MGELIGWLKDDWKNARFQLIVETLGTICLICALTFYAWYGIKINPVIPMVLNLFGGIFIGINSYLRKSVNLLILNGVCIIIAGMGIIKNWN